MRVLFAVLFVMLAAVQASAEDWQVRSVCDLHKGEGSEGHAGQCAQLAAEVLMLLPEKAGPGNVAVLSDFTDNMEKAGVNWDAPCRDQAHCPESAYTIRYAFVSKKILTIPKDKIFSALVCREGFSETPPDDATCRLKLTNVLREMTNRARKEGALLALLKCGGAEGDAIRPDGQGVGGYELQYAFVQLPDMLPMAGNDTKAAARFAVNQLAGPGNASPATAPAVANAPASPSPAVAPVASVGQTVPQTVATDEFTMQVAALPSLVQAETVADRLSAKGVEAFFERADVNGREVYRVLTRSTGNPDAFRQKLAEMGYPGAILKR
jgi:cell division septation protein DedD